MNQEEMKQIQTIITNFHESKKYIPYCIDLENHSIFGPIFQQLSNEERKIVEAIINKYIVEDIAKQKTKGGELFRRFYQLNEEKFRNFRELNCSKYQHSTNEEFQKLGKEVENDIFVYEGILTERMLKQEKGLDKVLSSFYNIVYSYFPKMNEVK